MDSLRQWIRSDMDVIMVGTWMLCGNGYGLIWTLSWLAHGCSAETTAGTRFSAAKSRKHRKDRCVRCLHVRASTTPRKTRQARRFRLQSPRNTVNTDVVGVCAVRMNSASVPLTRYLLEKPKLLAIKKQYIHVCTSINSIGTWTHIGSSKL